MKLLLRYGLLVSTTVAGTAHWVAPTDDTPAFYSVAPARTTAPVLSGNQLTGEFFNLPIKVLAYQMAARIDKVLYAQPCYCRCDRALGHKSLHSCFEGTHGAVCATCMRQAIYSYQQTKAGKTPDQIREGIQRGEWQNVDLETAAL